MDMSVHVVFVERIIRHSFVCGMYSLNFPMMNKNKKILFLHGFFASGQCVPALSLREALKGKAEVITPDLPIHPEEAMRLIKGICDREKPDVLVGNSCGSFYAQMTANIEGIPALLGNPYFMMTEFLKTRIGEHEYKSPRQNGRQGLMIDEKLISEFAAMETVQFDCCKDENRELIWGLFGENDTLAHFEPLFLKHYKHAWHFPGGHTPTADEVTKWYVPLTERLMMLKE